MEYSLFMIKPCAYDKKKEILDIISKKLTIVSVVDKVLNEEFLTKLYKNVSNNKYKEINIQFLKNKLVCIGIVEGENAIQDLIDICGNKPLGTMCKEGTIRNIYNPKVDTITINDQILYINAIHKSDAKDAVNEVMLFYEYCNDEKNKKSYKYKKDNN